MIPLHDDNPTTLKPVVTIALIGACILIYLWQFSFSDEGQQAIAILLGAIPANILGTKSLPPEMTLIPPAATLLTSMFLHGGWLHLIGNMLYLWIFGNNIEDILGHFRFVLFYLVCGIVAALGHALPNPESTIPMIGASGAISGVLGAYLLRFPHARVLVLIPLGFLTQLIRIRAVYVLGLWFVIQLISSLFTQTQGGGVAWGAHIGGFIAGLLLVPLFQLGARNNRR